MFALSEPGRLEEVIAAAGLTVRDDDEIDCPIVFDDVARAERAFMAAGPTQLAIGSAGERTVAETITSALESFTDRRRPSPATRRVQSRPGIKLTPGLPLQTATLRRWLPRPRGDHRRRCRRDVHRLPPGRAGLARHRARRPGRADERARRSTRAGLVGQLRGSVTLTRMMMYGVRAVPAPRRPRRASTRRGTRSARSAWRRRRSGMEELARQAGWAKTFGLPHGADRRATRPRSASR